MTTLAVGDRVRVGRNDARVPVGAEGRVVGFVTVSGNVLVDVVERGRVALRAEQIAAINGEEVAVSEIAAQRARQTVRRLSEAEPGSNGAHAAPKRDKVEPAAGAAVWLDAQGRMLGVSRPLYLSQTDAAAELRVSENVLRVMAEVLGLQSCGGKQGRTCRYTAPDLRRLGVLRATMREFGVDPMVAARIQDKLGPGRAGPG